VTEQFTILRDIVSHETGLGELAVTPQTAMAELPGWDSVTMTCVILAVEKRFGFTFTPEEMDRLGTFNDFLLTIQAKAATG
jgi:acyl carrier protein